MFHLDPRLLYEHGVILPGTDSEEAYEEWVQQWEGQFPVPMPAVAHGYGIKLWVVIRILAKDFGEKMEYNEEFGTLMPIKGFGELWGVATKRDQVDKLIDPAAQRSASAYVFLVYKLRLRTEEQWMGMLNFAALNGMLEPET